MTKATKKTTGRNVDAEDRLGARLGRATALVHVIAQASPLNVDHTQYHMALEAVWDLLNGAREDWDEVSDVLDTVEWPKPEPAPVKPLDKATADKAIKAIKGLTKAPKQKKGASGANDANGTQMPGEQSLNFGGGVQ